MSEPMHRVCGLRLALLLACAWTRAAAGVLEVPAQYATIQAAIDAASNGDSVLVAPGTYAETIDFHGKAISIVSSGGAAITIIDGGGAGSVVSFASGEGAGSILQGFTITGGTGSIGPVDEFGTPGLVGGGVKVISSSPRLVDLVITGNTAPDDGGGVLAWDAPASPIKGPELANCTVSGNSAHVGGGIAVSRAILALDGCTLLANSATIGGGLSAHGGFVTVDGCTISGNAAGFGGGVIAGGAVPLTGITFVMTDCSVSGNTATTAAGGFSGEIMNDGLFSGGSIVVESCRLEGNSAPYGAALDLSATSGGILVRSCLITGNGPSGSVAVELLGPLTLNGCTLVDNLGPAANSGGGNSGLINSIVWDNAQPLVLGTAVTWSDVQDGWPGEGNLDVDPLFVDAAAGDYHLQSGSPCRDATDPDTFFFPGSLDIDLEPRVQGPAMDMGCDEVFTDCNGNGQSDPLDIQSGLSSDCDGNGVPDECDPFVDCNGNGLNDSCDIALGLETDCDADGVPDSCQAFADCNGNGVLDMCDLAAGTSEDCNGNGVPDECDIASGASLDVDGDGQPDECQAVLMVPGEYKTIQAAIDAAENGDTIALADGTYAGFGNVNLDVLGKELTIASLGGAAHCILDGGGSARLVALGVDESAVVTRLLGLTLQHGQASFGGGLLAEDGAQLVAEDCRFEACNAQIAGGAALVRAGAAGTFRRCVFAENTCRNGGALRAVAAQVEIEHCTFSHNGSIFTVSKGGTLSAEDAAIVVVRDSILRNGYAVAGPEIYAAAPGTAVGVATSDVAGGAAAVALVSGGALSWGAGNIDADPLFKDAATGDFRLAGGSPCIDSADPAGMPDADGTPPDMGAIPFAPWMDLGFALAGAAGAPQLVGAGALLPSEAATLTLSGAPSGAAFTLVLGASPLFAPLKGGTLVPAATLVLPGVAGPDGSVTLKGRWPADVTPGLIAYLQVWIADASGPAGFTATNGLAAEAR